ncbi:MAG TPA: TetR family transcriptional regulator [Gaiellaceae bacterium]|jgi:AcrR family transcriptional regulator
MTRRGSTSAGERTGRRPGQSTTRAEILAAARGSFAELGYDRTSVRGVAGRAGVDPALVHRFFGGKDDLLAAVLAGAMAPAERIPDVMGSDSASVGERLAAYFFWVWEESPSRDVLVGMLRSAVANEHAAALLRDFFAGEVLSRIAAPLEGDDARLRANLVSSQLVGLALLRYILRFEPLASAQPEAIAAAIAPTLQRYLTGEL